MLEKQVKFEVCENEDFDKYFDEHLYIFQYEGIMRKMILNYKFNEKSYLYMTFVNFLLKDQKIFKKLNCYDTIIPVPISRKRKMERGYNQSLLIAKELVKKMNIENLKLGSDNKIDLSNNNLIKTKNIIEQSKLGKEDRIRNIQGVYELKNKEILENRKVLLIDDIYTTGSTVNECSRVLKQANIDCIGVFTLAKD